MLKIQLKDGRADAIALVEPGKTIGKGDVNDIVINEGGITGFHADLKVERSQVTLSDIGVGITLNGDALSGPTVVRVGDIIIVKGVELEVVEDDDVDGGSKTLVLSGTTLLEVGAGA
jgi:pSer/pThr/pTyr-binding forkhead associated (FHA) protein